MIAENLPLSILKNAVFENTAEAIMITDKNNRIITVNSALELITGYKKQELIGKNPNYFSSGRHDKSFYQQMWDDLLVHDHWKGELYNQRKNGEVFPEELSLSVVRNEQGKVSNFIGIFRDISRFKATEKQLSFYANNESLTGLANRRRFIHAVEQQIAVSKRHDSLFCVLFLDIDRFKEVNDVHGHHIGDQLLRAVADRLAKIMRIEDMVCRYGGDEFTILLTNTSTTQSRLVAEKCRNELSKTFKLEQLSLDITCSIGIAEYTSGATATTLLRNANHAMHSIKKQEQGGITFHNDALQVKYLAKLKLRDRLKLAIEYQQFEVYYQPIVDLPHHSIDKFEALVRWPDGNGGFISPATFIPIAEEFNLIHRVGQFVLDRACHDLKQLHLLGYTNVSFSINRSISEFSQKADQGNIISQAIAAAGLPYESIVIEITESVAMSSSNHTEQALADLRACGVKVALDDFCTGYSSLSNLIEYKTDFLKIDKSFVDSMLTDNNHQILVSTLIDLAKKLDMRVIAEGVENKQQLEMLRGFGCHYIQGFYFSPALPYKRCVALLRNSQTRTNGSETSSTLA